MTRRLITAIAALLVLSVVTPMFATGAAADSTVTIPTANPINSDNALTQWETEERVQRSFVAPKMTVTISSDRSGANLSFTKNPLEGSTRNDFIRITYQEELDRTIRIPIHADYFDPFPREGLDSLSDKKAINLEPVTIDGEVYTMITIQFKKSGSYVFPIPEDAHMAYNAMERTENISDGYFGVNLGLTETPWNRIDKSALEGKNISVPIATNDSEKLAIEYNAGTATDPKWVPVPDEPVSGKPVYRMKRDGETDVVYVVSRSSEGVGLRYKQNAGVRDRVSAGIRSAKRLPKNIGDMIGVDIPEIGLPW